VTKIAAHNYMYTPKLARILFLAGKNSKRIQKEISKMTETYLSQSERHAIHNTNEINSH
jgi:hypothetical protein